MSAGSRLRSFVRALAGRQRLDRDMDEEWTFHLEQRVAALAAAGMSQADADRQARLEFGDRLRWKEQGRDARGLGWLHDIGSDIRYGLRQLRRAPAFAAVAIATLALGIGANAAMFSIAHALLMRPLPVVEPQRLIAVGTPHDIDEAWTYAIWDAFRRRSDLFDGAFAFSHQRFDLSERGETEPVEGLYASGDFFSVLGVQALAGRLFTSADDVHEVGAGPDGPVTVISYGFWQRRFGGEDVVGRTLRIQRVPFTIIGVTPRSSFGPEVGRSFDVAVPLNTERLVRGAATTLGRESGNYALRIMLRLKPDQSIGDAAAILRTLQPRIRDESMPTLPPDYQAQFLKDPFTPVAAARGISSLRGQYQTPLIATMAIVGIVLLITCANLANLLIARATARRHELSVRLALGAGRWRLVRQVFVETLMLSTAGTMLGALLAVWVGDLLVQQLSTVDNPVMLDLTPDPLFIVFSASAALLTAMVFGAAPAWRVTRVAPGEMLKAAGRTATARGAMSPALVIAQIALSMILVVASGLFIRTMIGLARLDLGIDSARILLVNVDMARTGIAPPNRAAFISSIIERLGTLPGVESVAASRITPIGGGGIIDEISVAGGVSNPTGESTYGLPRFWNANSSMLNIVTPGWFATYGMTLHRGRTFTDADLTGADPVAIVNEAFVRKFLSDREPLGSLVVHRIGSQKGTQRRVVGVVNDAVYDSLRGGVRPVMFVPLVRGAGPTTIPLSILPLSIRSAAGDPAVLSGAVAAALSSLEPNLAFSFRSLPERVAATFANERLLSMLSAFFGGLALLLAAIGLYGVTAYSVARRRSEIGIRLALGAGPRRVVRQVLGSVFVLVAIGVIVGAATSAFLTRFVASLLYGLGPHDPGTLASAALVLAAVGAVAGWLPAYRASRIDPAEVLREN
jgi:putative ABC transport system permease protein